jgi:hypothetical protein
VVAARDIAMTLPSKRTIVIASLVCAGFLLLGTAIIGRGPRAKQAPEAPTKSAAANAGDGAVGGEETTLGGKEGGTARGRHHRVHQPHELPDESLPRRGPASVIDE